jgi:PEP-CTERM motif
MATAFTVTSEADLNAALEQIEVAACACFVEQCAQFTSRGVWNMTRKVTSRLSYLAGTALLSSIISMTGAKAQDANPDVVLTSPSGVYYAFLDNGQVVVSQGTNPTISGINPATTNTLGIFSMFPTVPAGDTVSLADNGLLTVSTTTKNPNPPPQTVQVPIAFNGPSAVVPFGVPPLSLFNKGLNDPVVGYNVNDITYDIQHPTVLTTAQTTGQVDTLTNSTDRTQVFLTTLTLTHTDSTMQSLSVSDAITAGIKTTVDVQIPVLGASKTELSLSTTHTVTNVNGTTQSDTITSSSGATVSVPAGAVYEAVLTGMKAQISVPFTYTGDATYQDGSVIPIDGTGVFNGSSTSDFQTAIICVSQPGGCEAGVGGDLSDFLPPGFLAPGEEVVAVLPATPVPEPSTWAMMLLGFAGLGLAGYRRARAGRGTVAA